ncbi:MAG: hypothetical protein K9H64_18685 [Bacteroidales bacterium]|nr:hypothetical protein [Bacteroidales bacterium]MCF8458083.1 hypothetical protein [Bacteroidales bacterium]
MKISIYILIVLLVQSCSSETNNDKKTIDAKNNITLDYTAGPPITIYKTKKDYSQFVAVSLSDDKRKIVSYPHPADVFYKGKLAYPTNLVKGYLLDNLGINVNVAYLSLTLEQYSKYKEIPSLEALYNLIIDKNPLTEYYFCGNRLTLKDEIVDLNMLINSDGLGLCECLVKE